MKRFALALFLLAGLSIPAQAHFVWILPTDTPGQVQVVFSDGMGPDKNVPVTKIGQTKLYGRGQSGAMLTLTKKGNAYLAMVPEGSSTVGGQCVYGVLAKGDAPPFLLIYHPRAVVGTDVAALKKDAARAWKKLPLQIVLASSQPSTGCQGIVLLQGKPLAKAEVVVKLPGQDEDVTVETSDEGTFTFAMPKQAGTIAIRARHIENKAGSLDGKNYKEVRHYATLTLPTQTVQTARKQVVASGKADPAATKLLQEAREARAEWENFPGFTATLEVNTNGQVQRGTATIAASGRVMLEGFKNEQVEKMLQAELRSLVQHRLSNSSDRETPCSFADKNSRHPLGRKINVLNDELHSSYRIRDRQIIEVFRDMGKVRFTITVLNNLETPEKKFLPTAYVVNTWDKETGQLISSQAHYNTWKRQGKYDLPELILTVTSRGINNAAAVSTNAQPGVQAQSQVTRAIRFSNVRLLERK